MAKLPTMNAKPMGPKPMGLGRGKPRAAMPGRMAREGMPSTGTKPMGLGRGKPRAAAMLGRMAREGMNSPAVMPRKTPVTPPGMAGSGVTPSQFMPRKTPVTPPGMAGSGVTPSQFMPSSAQIARNKQEGAARVNAMSPMDRLSQNAPKFKG